MTTLRAAAQQALEALERYSGVDQRACDAEEALRTALSEPEQWHCDDCGGTDPECPYRPRKPAHEPVAWGMPCPDGQIVDVITPEEHAKAEGAYRVPLYREFVCSTGLCRYRKPLTDEEISAIDWKSNETLHDFARAIERAHGIGGEA